MPRPTHHLQAVNAPRPPDASLRAALRAAAALGAVLLLSAGCGEPSASRASWAPRPDEAAGLRRVAFADGERLVLSTAGGQRTFIPGVNIGATVPGASPGELRASAADFRAWFRQIGELRLRAVRVYTIMPPHFYEELAAFNKAHAEAPLYLVQGVWIPEADFLTGQDLFAALVRGGFRRELEDAAAAVHGDLSRTRRRGVAWGDWTADASPWLLAYSIGVEWDPVATAASDEKNRSREPYRGRYFAASREASPTESWLAEMLDAVAAAEAARGVSLPLTFTNWPTTDPLRHPDEPLKREDLVGIDANHIAATAAWPGGYFASYHAYPYYPDFQRHEPALQAAAGGDPYAGPPSHLIGFKSAQGGRAHRIGDRAAAMGWPTTVRF
ncbi:MAG: hypothetical protein WC709_02685, partial [Thermoleophilia bacterium]